jgi:hypothetical protein
MLMSGQAIKFCRSGTLAHDLHAKVLEPFMAAGTDFRAGKCQAPQGIPRLLEVARRAYLNTGLGSTMMTSPVRT